MNFAIHEPSFLFTASPLRIFCNADKQVHGTKCQQTDSTLGVENSNFVRKEEMLLNPFVCKDANHMTKNAIFYSMVQCTVVKEAK